MNVVPFDGDRLRFIPSSTLTIAASTTQTTQALSGDADYLQIYNAAAVAIQYELGTSGVTVDGTGGVVLAGETLTIPLRDGNTQPTHIGIITVSSTGTVYVSEFKEVG